MSDFPTRILHVDDDAFICRLVEKALGFYDDVVIETFQEGRKLVEQAETFNPDMILLDMRMPNMNGVDTIKELRGADTPILAPVVILTAETNLKMCDEYRKLGIAGIIHKPVSAGVLPERLRYFWVEYQGRDDPIPGLKESSMLI